MPALVFVHGGPGGQTRTGYRALIQHLVNHGYAVLGANNRGSSGYGKTFYHLDDKRHGEDDLDDVVEIAERLAGKTFDNAAFALLLSSPAAALDWGGVPAREVVLFYPGQGSFEWSLTQTDHSGEIGRAHV